MRVGWLGDISELPLEPLRLCSAGNSVDALRRGVALDPLQSLPFTPRRRRRILQPDVGRLGDCCRQRL